MEAIIKKIVGDMIANMENECVKVCQSYGFDVDKERLTQALTDARKFYDEGYRDGKAAAMDEIVRCKDCKHRECAERWKAKAYDLAAQNAKIGKRRNRTWKTVKGRTGRSVCMSGRSAGGATRRKR